jgi:hypothetical protein
MLSLLSFTIPTVGLLYVVPFFSGEAEVQTDEEFPSVQHLIVTISWMWST